MHLVAQFFGKTRLEEIGASKFYGHIDELRRVLGDRPVLRAIHYFNEVALVRRRIEALRAGDFPSFVTLTQRSSASSAQYLQNLSVAGSRDQSAMVALALADIALDGHGSCRIHGGGFGGKIQVICTAQETDAFITRLDTLLGAGSCQPIHIVDEGAHAAWI